MSTNADEVIQCAACGTKNRVRSGMLSGTFRCGACQALLLRPLGSSWLVRAIHATPELFFRCCRGITALAIFSIPIWVGYSSLTHPAADTSTSRPSATPRPLPTPRSRQSIFSDSDTVAVPTPPPFNEPELPLPQSGEAINYSNRTPHAPFEIQSAAGTNYLVKLSDLYSGEPVMTIFVRGGSPVNVDVPEGTYWVKYAAGEKWYGYDYLFGPRTGYSKASETFTFGNDGRRYTGYTITLYKVRDGNLHTQDINPEDF